MASGKRCKVVLRIAHDKARAESGSLPGAPRRRTARPGDRSSCLGRPREQLQRRSGERRAGVHPRRRGRRCGASIEDYDPSGRLYDLHHAVERVAAAVEAARQLGFPFTLTARAENHIRGNPDLDDTIARLQAYEAAGADVLYAPGLRRPTEIRAVCEAVSNPVNVLALPGLSMAEITDAGAKAGQRRGRLDMGRGQRHGGRGLRDPRSRRLLVTRYEPSAPRMVRVTAHAHDLDVVRRAA
jgi:hypothetical protein